MPCIDSDDDILTTFLLLESLLLLLEVYCQVFGSVPQYLKKLTQLKLRGFLYQ